MFLPFQLICRSYIQLHVSLIILYIPAFQGAPETIQERLTNVPVSYVNTYKKYTRQGSRVLALAFKSLPDMTVRIIKNNHSWSSTFPFVPQIIYINIYLKYLYIYVFVVEGGFCNLGIIKSINCKKPLYACKY